MSPDGVRRTRVTAGAVLTAAVALAALAAVAVVSVNAGFLIVRSDSMAPSINAGSLVFTTPVDARDIQAGDVVTVRDNGEPVTKRVVTATLSGDETRLVMKGDGQSAPDRDAYAVRAADEVRWSVPYAGYVVDTVTSPVGLVAIGVLLVGLTLLTPALPEHAPLPGGRHRNRRRALPARSSVRLSLD